MYKQYFHFKELPFSIAPDPHFLYMSQRHQEGLAHLLYGINVGGGFIALTGEVGTGKTTLCHCLLQQLPEDVDIALILNPKLNALELLANICDELGIDYDPSLQSLKVFTDRLNKYLLQAHANGRRTVLMIDEAQNLSLEVLEQIRLLTNLETSKTKLLQIVLVGQPELKQLLNRKELRQLNQRITARYHLEPLSLNESRTYIKHRIAVSGGDTGIFRENAIRRIYKISQGIPRLINILCDRSLLGAYATGMHQITPGIVNKAAQEALDIERKRFTQIHLFSLLFLSICFALGAVYYFAATKRNKVETIAPAQVEQAPQGKTPAATVTTITRPEQDQATIQPLPTAAKKPQQTEPLPIPDVTSITDFANFIQNPELSLQHAMNNAFALWDQPVAEKQSVDCRFALQNGFRCLLDHGDLKDLLGLDRPAILEFTLRDQQKRYALLVAMDQGYPVLRAEHDVTVRLAELLNYWQGYFLILWKSPLPGEMQAIYPQQKAESVLWLRNQLEHIDGDTTKPAQANFFDLPLEQRVKVFQREHSLSTDGIVGSRTLIHLQNAYASTHFPKLKQTD